MMIGLLPHASASASRRMLVAVDEHMMRGDDDADDGDGDAEGEGWEGAGMEGSTREMPVKVLRLGALDV